MINYLAKNIRFLRENKGLKQHEMPTALGFNRTTWSNYENGNSTPAFYDLLKIVEFFDTTIDDLVFADLSKGNNSAISAPIENGKNSNLKGNQMGNLNANLQYNLTEIESQLVGEPAAIYGTNNNDQKPSEIAILSQKIGKLEDKVNELTFAVLKLTANGSK